MVTFRGSGVRYFSSKKKEDLRWKVQTSKFGADDTELIHYFFMKKFGLTPVQTDQIEMAELEALLFIDYLVDEKERRENKV